LHELKLTHKGPPPYMAPAVVPQQQWTAGVQGGCLFAGCPAVWSHVHV